MVFFKYLVRRIFQLCGQRGSRWVKICLAWAKRFITAGKYIVYYVTYILDRIYYIIYTAVYNIPNI